jgi:hypothetical protein
MKTLWNIFSFLAVVHLLALTMVIVWLWKSQRLTADRIHGFAKCLPCPSPKRKPPLQRRPPKCRPSIKRT